MMTGRGPFWGHIRLRLRSKLALILSIAALLPLFGASTVGVRLALGGLEAGVRNETSRSLRVALNLVLAGVKDLFENAVRLGEDERLAVLLREGSRPALEEFLEMNRHQMTAGLLEVTDARGHVVARRGEDKWTLQLPLRDGASLIRHALGWERRVTLEQVAGQVVVRAAAPVVDDEFQLRGAVVLSMPLDAAFADRLKAELATDVIIYSGEAPVASSFIAPDGRRRIGFPLPDEARDTLRRGGTAIVEAAAYGRTFSTGISPLLDLDGRQLGLFAVASDDEHLVFAKRQAWRSILFGGLAAFVLALVLAALAARSLTRPLGRLHEGARAVARGELLTNIVRETGDEIGDVAEAFAQMTRAVRENQERLAARMREILTLQEIGRAVSSVLTVDDVLRRIVEQLSAVLAADRTALLFTGESGSLQLGAAVNLGDTFPLRQLCQLLYWWDGPLLIEDLSKVGELSEAAAAVGMTGSLLAVPLEQKDDILGLLLVNRERAPLSDPDLRLVATFADHAATAIQNARLYDAVQRASEGLERKVADRTAELTMANRELERLVRELSQAQSQLVLSERMAGLGFLVAGIAHEINSPVGAIQGAIDSLGENLERLVVRGRDFARLELTLEEQSAYFGLLEELTPHLAEARLRAPAQVRRQARELAGRLTAEGIEGGDEHARTLVEIGALDVPLGDASAAGVLPIPDVDAARDTVGRLLPLMKRHGIDPIVGYLEQYAYLHRNVHAVRLAVRRITRLVGALKGYSHLDQAKVARSDLHEGIENTLVILHHELSRGIIVHRRFAELPAIPVYVDELNQVWTNLIHNAVQALGGQGEITIESRLEGDHVAVTVADNGPGIAPDIAGRIFEPFFTTKRAGEGTGLGLGIVRQIVDKHAGRIEVASRPGSTRFTVHLPVAGPPDTEEHSAAAVTPTTPAREPGSAAHG